MDKVYVFGHLKPDTDAVTSSIALAYLKRQLGIQAEARILSDINKETQFVLDYYGVSVPKYLDSVRLQLKDINYYHDYYVLNTLSINDTYTFLLDHNLTAVPVVDNHTKLMGMVRVKDLLKQIKKDSVFLKTSYANLLSALCGESINYLDDEIEGTVTAKGNFVLIGEHNKLNLIISCKDSSINKDQFNDVNIIKSSLDLIKVIQLLPWCNYISGALNDEDTYAFKENTYYDEFVKETDKLSHNNYPIIGKHNICQGLIRITDIDIKNRKKVILVDHNEAQQSVDGLDESEIIEIVDHHKIGAVSTNFPISFRNMTVGSTNTIIYQMYRENHIEIPKYIAGLMISGILSDTLGLSSSTTTIIDQDVVHKLANLLHINYKEYYLKMLKAGTSLEGETKESIVKQDLKYFQVNDLRYAISQVITLDIETIIKDKDEYLKIINNYQKRHSLTLVLLVITDAIKKGSYILYTDDASNMLKEIYHLDNVYQGVFIPDLTSRKKQVVPYINEYLK